MSEMNTGARTTRRASRKPEIPIEAPAAHRERSPERARTTAEVAALVRLAEQDLVLLERRAPAGDAAVAERRGLAAKLSHEILDAYDRALRAGRRPAVVRLVASVCSGCHVRLHAKLDHQIRLRRGVAPCPHCLRLVYDPAWLTP